MDSARIEYLLERYWTCESSLEEEQELGDLLRKAGSDPRWNKEAALFGYFDKQKEEDRLGVFFDQRVMDEISRVEKKRHRESKGKVIRLWQEIGKVAAVLLVLTMAIIFVRQEYMQNKTRLVSDAEETFEDPREAFEATKQALMLISQSMNKGKKEATKIGVFHEAQEIVKDDLVSNDTKKNTTEDLQKDPVN